MSEGRDYATGVRRSLAAAGLYFAGVAPLVQFAVFRDSTPGYPHPTLVWAVFALHFFVWAAAVFRRVPAALTLVSWSAVGVMTAAQLAMADAPDPVAPRNIALTIAATAALLLPLRAAIACTVAVSLASAAALLIAAPQTSLALWSMATQIPVYSMGVVTALALAFRELARVARSADEQAGARLDADRTVRRKELAAQASRRRARMMHDTIVNTLGAIANGRITVAGPAVAQRCTEDVRAVDVLRRGATRVEPVLRDVFSHAGHLGVDVVGAGIDDLQDRLDSDESWRRREIIAALKETLTNAAKHAGVSVVHLAYDPTTCTATVTDTGSGMSDTATLSSRLVDRARDSQTEIEVISRPGQGTRVTLRIAPLPDTAPEVFESAATRMATAISVVMLAQFAAVTAVTLTFQPTRSAADLLAPTVTWLVVAGTLALILRHQAPQLPVHVVAAGYLGLAAIALIYDFTNTATNACGLHPHLAWVGDAIATLCAVLVLVDGRLRVVLPAVALTLVGVAVALREAPAACVGLTFGLIVTDILVIGAFYILRRQTLKLSRIVAAEHDDQIRRREDQERLAVEEALYEDGFDTTLEFSRRILRSVAEQPERIHEPQLRAAAGLEEGYLRAFIGLTADVVAANVKRQFVGAIDAARTAGVRVSVHAEPRVLSEDSAAFVSDTVRTLVTGCATGDEVSVGIFGPPELLSMFFVAPPSALPEYAGGPEHEHALITVTADLGLVEVRWDGGAHRDHR